jgi:hypothetical protein
LACGDVFAAPVGVAAPAGIAVVVGVAALVGVLDGTAAVGVEVAGAGAGEVVDEVVVAVEPVLAPECEVSAGVAPEWLSASCRS